MASETQSWARGVCGGFETLTGRCGCDAFDATLLSLQHCVYACGVKECGILVVRVQKKKKGFIGFLGFWDKKCGGNVSDVVFVI